MFAQRHGGILTPVVAAKGLARHVLTDPTAYVNVVGQSRPKACPEDEQLLRNPGRGPSRWTARQNIIIMTVMILMILIITKIVIAAVAAAA